MADLVIQVGGSSAQGLRSNNEDRFLADLEGRVFLVADGLGGQDCGEKASGMAVDIIPRVLHDRLAAGDDASHAVQRALAEANEAIISAGAAQNISRRMGTTAVLAVRQDDQVYVASVGDSRAYLIRGARVEQLTVDHTVAEALTRNGTLTPDQAKQSPWRNVLHKFLGCVDMTDGAEVLPLTPEAGDRLVMGSDGLTNFLTEADLREGAVRYLHPQEWADHMVESALQRGSKDNVTCVVVAFNPE
jgi:PPM family protein phosphatase